MARDSRICDNDMRKILIFFFTYNPTFWSCDSEGCIFIVRGIGYCLSTIVSSCVYCSVFYIGNLHDGVIFKATTTRILFIFPFIFTFCNPSEV